MKKLLLILLTLTASLTFAQNSYVIVEAQFDSYGPQESYFYISNNTDTLYYYQPTQANELLVDTIFLNVGSYTLSMFDSWGDGWQDSGTTGYINIQNNCQGLILEIPADFAFGVATYDFNIGPCDINGPPPVIGCMDTNAVNYDSTAVFSDNSCVYPPCGGFLTSDAYDICINHGTQTQIVFEWTLDANASCEVVSVHYSNEQGLGPYIYSAPSANNFGVWAGNGQMPPNWSVEHYLQLEFADGSMSDTIAFTPTPCIAGCTDPTQQAYNPWATTDDGSCSGTTCDPATEYQITMAITLDNWPQETSWNMVTNSGSGVNTPTGTYTYNDIGQTYVYDFCVSSTAGFEFILNDSYGDGMVGVNPQEAGEVVIYDCNGDTITYLSSGTWSDGANNVGVDLGGYPNGSVAYSTPQQATACDAIAVVDGCTDPSYQEYNPLANNNDSTCVNLHTFGCIDSASYNYDPSATQMEIIDLCNYTLTIEDGAGDGWGNSYLGVMQGVNTWTFTMGPGSYSESFPLTLETDKPVKVYYFEVPNIQNPDPQQTAFQTFQNSFILENADGVVLLDEGSNPFSNNGQGALQGFDSPFWVTYEAIPYCGDYCEPFTYGCTDPAAVNYDNTVNTENGSCYYAPGCTSSAYLEYYTQGFVADYDDNSCQTTAIWGCTDSTMYNFDPVANISNGGCIPFVYGCMDPTAFNYDPLATAEDTCIAYYYGCTDPTAFNYNPLANADNGGCEEVVFGCTDSTMWNYNALANTDNGSCVVFAYGCTDNTALNFDPLANTLDNSCCYIAGCTDPTALNYNEDACFDNNSCIEIIPGCTDPDAENYNIVANVSDSSCYYSANCAVGDVYYLPNACFSWVIDIDSYCCDISWDNSCVELYQYCEDGWTGPVDISEYRNEIVTYPNPTSDYIYVNKKVDLKVYNLLGDIVIEKVNVDVLDVSILAPGLYNVAIEYNKIKINKKIIKTK